MDATFISRFDDSVLYLEYSIPKVCQDQGERLILLAIVSVLAICDPCHFVPSVSIDRIIGNLGASYQCQKRVLWRNKKKC